MNPFEFLYYLGCSAKRRYCLARARKLPFPVISIGNITTGGTGKTPAAIALAQKAVLRGFFPIILTRGYTGTAQGPCFVSRGDGPLLNAREAGDEALLIALSAKGVPVVKGADRYGAGIFALAHLGRQTAAAPGVRQLPVLFILDDGFQHWKLHRDMDIVLVNAANPFGNGRLLPSGRLREQPAALARAHVIILTKTISHTLNVSDETDASGTGCADQHPLIQSIRKHNPDAPVFCAEHKPAALHHVAGEHLPVSQLSGKRIFAFCGLADPEAFRMTLESAGADVAGFRAFRDHYHYTGTDLRELTAEASRCHAEWIVTTEKDIIKLVGMDSAMPDNLFSLEIAFSVSKDFYEHTFNATMTDLAQQA